MNVKITEKPLTDKQIDGLREKKAIPGSKKWIEDQRQKQKDKRENFQKKWSKK